MSYAVKDKTVIREDTGQVVKEHPTQAHALAHLQALRVSAKRQAAEWAALDEQAEGWLPTDEQLEESAKTAGYSVTPHPFSTSKTSNWVARAGGLPAYITNVAHGLLKSGRSESQAIQMAVGIVKRWAKGGGKVSAEVRAAAAKAVAEWEALKTKSHAKAAAS